MRIASTSATKLARILLPPQNQLIGLGTGAGTRARTKGLLITDQLLADSPLDL